MDTELHGLPGALGRYELKSLLGTGGMGRVVRAHDPVLKRDVALKLVEAQAAEPDELPELRRMFHREARATASLHHGNIIEILDYSGPDAEIPFIACELIDGPTLRTILDERTRLAPDVVTCLGYELAQAVGYAHAANVLHRDLKPENIFWTRDGRVVLSDFGIAKLLKADGSVALKNTNLYGSPSYIAPELLDGAAATTAVDCYALGALLFEALTGVLAFDGNDLEEIFARVRNGERSALPAGVHIPAKLIQLVDALLARRPSERPSVGATQTRLREILDDLGVADPRLALRDWGRHVVAHPPAAEVTASLDAAATVVAAPRRRRLSQRVAQRGPRRAIAVQLGLTWLIVALLLLAAVYAFNSTPTATPAPPSIQAQTPVVTVIHSRLTGTLVVDGIERGPLTGSANVLLLPGLHRLELVTSERRITQNVVVIAMTRPVFELE